MTLILLVYQVELKCLKLEVTAWVDDSVPSARVATAEMRQLDWKMGQMAVSGRVGLFCVFRVHPLELHFFWRNNWNSLEVRASFITTKIRHRKHSDSNSTSRRDAAAEFPLWYLLSIRFEHPDSHQLSMRRVPLV